MSAESCETCWNYDYDEEYDEYYCSVNLDEDEMEKYILPDGLNWYRANFHCHTVHSDGAYTPEELVTIGKRLGHEAMILTDHDTVKGQRKCHILVFFYPAVIVGIQITDPAVLIERILLDIQTGGIDVCGGDTDTVVDILGTNAEKEDVLAAIVIVEFVACLDGRAKGVGTVSCRLGKLYALANGLALGLGGVQKLDVALSVFVGLGNDLFAGLLVNGLLLIDQMVSLFRHVGSPFYGS